MDSIRFQQTRDAALIALVAALLSGCPGGGQSADSAMKAAMKASGIQQENVVPFAGKVLVDGKPPSFADGGLVVLLWNDKKPPKDATTAPHAVCNTDGDFEFMTYKKGDGVPPGTYTICFAQLQMGSMTQRGYEGPDKLKNLYNDPDKNKENKEFVIEVAPPGKTDYEFKLDVEGKPAVEPPGEHAITRVQG